MILHLLTEATNASGRRMNQGAHPEFLTSVKFWYYMHFFPRLFLTSCQILFQYLVIIDVVSEKFFKVLALTAGESKA